MSPENTPTDTAAIPAPEPHTWVARYADYLYAYAITRINDDNAARDLVQETFLAALERLDKFEGKSTERTWLTAILKYKIIDIYRKKASVGGLRSLHPNIEHEHTAYFDESTGHWNDDHRPIDIFADVADPLDNKELNKILKACMEKLPALWLAVFAMKHMDDESTEMICGTLSVSLSNFWVIMHRAKVNLRACIQKNWER